MCGNSVKEYFKNEGGLHKFIRIPPTEKRGRTHTSTISVAITDPTISFDYKLDRSQVKRQYTCSGGKGGQHVNRRSTACQLTHIPSGIQVKVQDTRTQAENEIIAWKRLEEKIKLVESDKYNSDTYSDRFDQIGYGKEKHRRTYRVKENIAIDHLTNKSCPFKNFDRGQIELLS